MSDDLSALTLTELLTAYLEEASMTTAALEAELRRRDAERAALRAEVERLTRGVYEIDHILDTADWNDAFLAMRDMNDITERLLSSAAPDGAAPLGSAQPDDEPTS